MRFDPRLIQPDDAPLAASGEIDLPDDLLELAAQLTEDANFLAARYPAAKVEPVVAEVAIATQANHARSWRPWVVVGGGSLAAASLFLAMMFVQKPNHQTPVPSTLAHAPRERVEAPATSIAANPITTPVINVPAGPRIERLPWAPTPAITNVSGPELEGLLDLWQNNDESAETRIEI